MTSHRWGEPDKDGVRACLRSGCTVRRGSGMHGMYWQRKQGGHWRHEERQPLPPCAGTDAPEATPSPLEVVRKSLEPFAHYAMRRDAFPLRGLGEGIHGIHAGSPDKEAELTMTHVRAARSALAALATLEESIRADEREACAKVAQEVADSWRDAIQHATDAAMRETATWAERACMDVAHSIRSRGKL